MTDLKVGDRVRLSNGVEATIGGVFDRSGTVKFEDYDSVSLEFLAHLGITWELIKPELVEPPAGSVIRFRDRVAVREPYEGLYDFHWGVKDDPAVYSWQGLVHEYNITEFDLLRPEKEVVAEALRAVHDLGVKSAYAAALQVAREHGVVL